MAEQQILILDVFGDYVTFLENNIICTARRDEYIFDFTLQNQKGEEQKYLLNDAINTKLLMNSPYNEMINKNREYLLPMGSAIYGSYLEYINSKHVRALETFLWYIRNCTILENHHGIYYHCTISDIRCTIKPFYENEDHKFPHHTLINEKILHLLREKGEARYLLNIEECKPKSSNKIANRLNGFLRIKYFNFNDKVKYTLIYKPPYSQTTDNLKLLVEDSKIQFCKDYNLIDIDFSFNLYDTIDQYILRYRKI